MNADQFAKHCLGQLQELEKSVPDQQLFNVGYIIPQLELLHAHWQQQSIEDTAEVFFDSLLQMIDNASDQDGLDADDRQMNEQILAQLKTCLA